LNAIKELEYKND